MAFFCVGVPILIAHRGFRERQETPPPCVVYVKIIVKPRSHDHVYDSAAILPCNALRRLLVHQRANALI